MDDLVGFGQQATEFIGVFCELLKKDVSYIVKSRRSCKKSSNNITRKETKAALEILLDNNHAKRISRTYLRRFS